LNSLSGTDTLFRTRIQVDDDRATREVET
jgi:hypothetical protein